MTGAICGDVIGSKYEKKNIKTKNFELLTKENNYTDDTIMTCAIAKACIEYKKSKDTIKFRENCIKNMRTMGLKYINAGYGGYFIQWILSSNPQPYNSYGNGSAMRVSPIAYVSNSLEEVEQLAEISASVSHNHPEGIKGAKAVASAIWLLLSGESKDRVKEYIETKYYKLDFTIDEIRPSYKFDVTCQGTIPQAIMAFLESNDFEEAIRIAISLGGDSDTIAAITGGLAEAYYSIPKRIISGVKEFLDDYLIDIIDEFNNIKKLEKGGKLK